jgi:hypothetical protein
VSAFLDGDEVPPPLRISSRLMASLEVTDTISTHLHAVGRDEEGRVVYHYVVEEDGTVVHEGRDLCSGARGSVDYRTMTETLVAFLLYYSEHYVSRYGHEMGMRTTCHDYPDQDPCPILAIGEWAYMNHDELQGATLELTDTDA